jgi:crotonobetainyl-CoA:carnitine CoA-transferase CaiB-like acyl-CoA transferase
MSESMTGYDVAQSYPEPNRALPLSGLRVMELTIAWAGPTAGRILAFLGAEVIHIESANAPDTWRAYSGALVLSRYPDRDPGLRRHNRCALFNSQNTDKLSLSLDLKAPGGKATFADLIKTSDVLVTNFTPGMLDRLDFGETALRALNPEICVVEMPAYGNDGPMSTWAALGPTMEQVAGMCAVIGYGDGKPNSTGPAYLDPIGGYHGAAAALTALYHRQKTGSGQHVEVPQVEAAMHAIGELLVAAAVNGADPFVQGNRLADAAPHDAYPTAGEPDQWVVIHVASDEDWERLCNVVADPALRDEPGYSTLAGRLQHRDAIDERLSTWTRTRDKHAVAEALQAAGVIAAAVYRPDDILACDYLNTRGFSQPLTHREAGTHLHQGLPFRFEANPIEHRAPAPCLGEHNDYILRQVLGRSDAEIQALQASGAIRAERDR